MTIKEAQAAMEAEIDRMDAKWEREGDMYAQGYADALGYACYELLDKLELDDGRDAVAAKLREQYAHLVSMSKDPVSDFEGGAC